jgi:hypothetical protein
MSFVNWEALHHSITRESPCSRSDCNYVYCHLKAAENSQPVIYGKNKYRPLSFPSSQINLVLDTGEIDPGSSFISLSTLFIFRCPKTITRGSYLISDSFIYLPSYPKIITRDVWKSHSYGFAAVLRAFAVPRLRLSNMTELLRMMPPIALVATQL